MMDLFKKYKRQDDVTQIIIVNVLVAIVTFVMSKQLVQLFSLPLNFSEFIYQPWSLFTAIFLHNSIRHILFNMLWFCSLPLLMISVYRLNGFHAMILVLIDQSFSIFNTKILCTDLMLVYCSPTHFQTRDHKV